MPDYGHDLMFGAMLEPERAADAVALAVLAEQAGLDAVSLADHPYWPERLDTFCLLAYIAARTDRVRVFPNLANLPLRPPTMLARTAATMDVLSDGRFELGIGSGAQQMWDAIVAEGGPLRSAAESIDALAEAVQVIRALWTTGPEVPFTGKHYRISGAKPDPRRHMTWASGWVPTSRGCWDWSDASPTAGYPVRRTCRPNSFLPPTRSSTRPRSTPAGLRKQCVASTTSAASSAEPPRVSSRGRRRCGSELTELTFAHGVSGFTLPLEPDDTSGRFAGEVVPAVRNAVSAERERQERLGSDRCQK